MHYLQMKRCILLQGCRCVGMRCHPFPDAVRRYPAFQGGASSSMSAALSPGLPNLCTADQVLMKPKLGIAQLSSNWGWMFGCNGAAPSFAILSSVVSNSTAIGRVSTFLLSGYCRLASADHAGYTGQCLLLILCHHACSYEPVSKPIAQCMHHQNLFELICRTLVILICFCLRLSPVVHGGGLQTQRGCSPPEGSPGCLPLASTCCPTSSYHRSR